MNKNFLSLEKFIIDPGVIIIKIVKNVIAQSLVSLVSYESNPGFISFVLKRI